MITNTIFNDGYMTETLFRKPQNRYNITADSRDSLVYPLRKGEYLKESFEVAKILMKDSEDLVQKGYSWMLKEASDLYQKEVFDFVMVNKKLMLRMALRCAIEKLPVRDLNFT